MRVMDDPLLECRHAEITEGSAATKALEFSVRGPSAMVVGAPAVLPKAAMGLVPLRKGALRVYGWSAVESVRRGIATGVPRDLVVPRNWTLRRMLVESARLSGLAQDEAQERAATVSVTLRLVPILDRSLALAPPVMRRAAALASALVTRAQVLMIDDLFEGLSFTETKNFGEVTIQVLEGRQWVCFCSRLQNGHPLAPLAHEMVTLSPGKPAHVSSPISSKIDAPKARALRIRLRGDIDKFIDDVGGAGVTVLAREDDQIFVALGERTSADLFALALSKGSLITELAPADAALAS